MELKQIYNHVKKIIENIDFSKLWPGFKNHQFALYNDEIVIMEGKEIQKTEQFVGNTAIKYEGDYIAIWYLLEPMDETILASKLVHEMFHAFQKEQNELRFPDEFDGIIKYENSLENLQIKYLESEYLLALEKEFSNEEFNKFLNLRLSRKNHYQYQYDYESKIEIVEGMAQYIEIEALKQLDIKKYNLQLKNIKNRIADVKNYFPIRIISYDIGTLLVKILMDNHIDFDQSIKDNKKLLLDNFLTDFNITDIRYHYNEDVSLAFKNDLNKLEDILSDFKNNHQEKFTGEFTLKAFNAYNGRFYKGYIYSQYFIMLEEKGFLFGNFLLKMDDKKVVEVYKL